jgi:hypothetical protein
MKQKKLMFAIIMATCMVVTSCSKEDASQTVSKEYSIRVGLGDESYVGNSSPGLNALWSSTKSAIDAINVAQAKIAVTGKGSNEEEALKNAETQAIEVFNQRAEAIYLALINIQSQFETNRQLEADRIVLETEYYLHLEAVVFLEEADGEKKIIKREGSYKMDAVGGTDYSL